MTEDILTVNELFSGIGAQRKALLRLGIPHEVVGVCEIDKYAIQSYEAIYGETKNYGDICTAPRLDYADLWTYSFPCQDISVAGKQQGINENTRSGLLYQVQRLLEVAKREKTLPKYLLLENVKNLVGKQFKEQFFEWVYYLSELGYDTYWQVLNAKDYGIPQNRERVFAVSIRKDLNQTYEFPKPEELKIRLKDVLEDEVDEKYYISQDKVDKFIKNLENTNLLMVREATKKGYAEATVGDSINIEQPNSKTRRGRVGHGVAQTLTTSPQQVVVQPAILSKYGTNLDRTTDLSTTLMARDYKGFGNQAQIGIIEFPCIAASRGRYIENTDAGAPTEQKLEINTQGTTNTITTVQKDNYVIEKKILDVSYARLEGKIREYDEIAPTLTARDYKEPRLVYEAKIQQVGNYMETDSFGGNPQCGRVYDAEGICPTLNTMQGGDRQPKIIQVGNIPKEIINDNERQRRVYSDEGLSPVILARSDSPKIIEEGYYTYPNSDKKHQSNTVYNPEGISPTLDTMQGGNRQPKIIIDDTQGFDGVRTYEDYAPTLRACRSGLKTTDGIRIRKLTPLECWRLMGFDDEDFRKAEASGVSNTQLYKQAGNSIVVNVLEKIFENLCK